MTATTFFDTHESIKQLVSSGFTEKQAEKQVKLQFQTFISLQKKQTTIETDLHSLKTDFHQFRNEVKHKFDLVQRDIDEKFNYLDMKFAAKFNLLYWMIGGVLAMLSPLLANQARELYLHLFH